MNKKGWIVSSVTAAGAAVAAWFLFEPKKGAKRRRKLAKETKRVYNNAEKEVRKIGSGMVDTFGKIEDAAKNGARTVADGAGKLVGDKTKA